MPAQTTPEFQTAVEESRKLKSKPADNELLEMYALFKQATQDPPFEESKAPGMFDFKEKAKRSAWEKVAQEGVTPEEAQKKYVQVVNGLKDRYGYAG